ncbi:hypothetical protein B0T17DRAFT_516882 [Bombardia bombarda]|uniref:FAD-binding FR-type domain-containing protein n=1 Tax=Bombardia bombarda TaxID=252184 RepID=A0AA39XKG8_9PEZI|nr:hypothetical protein B0T17DRAFT_516882 [Bombardia bombarda]
MDGGEVSTYLSGLAVGDTVELRGPHLGFDVRGRLGTADRVVFLAGGTGIAPALQVVRALLGGDDRGQRGGVDGGVRKQALPSVSILWANRKRTDCAGCEQDEGGNDGDKSAIVSLLAEAKQRHGDRLKYACTVDEEGSFIGVGAITDATGLSPSLAAGSGSKPSSSWSSWFSWGMRKNSDTKAGSSAAAAVPITTRSIISSDGCVYHSAARLVFMAGHDSTDGGERKCECVDVHGKRAAAGGKNLLMVSGPEGFISAYAGAKILGAGGEVQGPLGGLVGNLKRRYPEFWADWMILKL